MRLIPTQHRILIFAKAPISGRVKTRLLSRLEPKSATSLHRIMVHETLAMVCSSRLAAVELWCASEHAFFLDCARHFPLELYEQKGEHLGSRLHFAMNQALSRCEAAVVIGTDCPAMNAIYIEAAFQKLNAGNNIVLGPAEDGGYVLIGARQIHPALFRDIKWGSNSVLSQTRTALQKLGWSWSELDTLWDVDRPEDLDRLRSDARFSHLLAHQ